MIIHRIWNTERHHSRFGKHCREARRWEGWFLFGIFPLYVRTTDIVVT